MVDHFLRLLRTRDGRRGPRWPEAGECAALKELLPRIREPGAQAGAFAALVRALGSESDRETAAQLESVLVAIYSRRLEEVGRERLDAACGDVLADLANGAPEPWKRWYASRLLGIVGTPRTVAALLELRRAGDVNWHFIGLARNPECIDLLARELVTLESDFEVGATWKAIGDCGDAGRTAQRELIDEWIATRRRLDQVAFTCVVTYALAAESASDLERLARCGDAWPRLRSEILGRLQERLADPTSRELCRGYASRDGDWLAEELATLAD
jgi:hypothetical protein